MRHTVKTVACYEKRTNEIADVEERQSAKDRRSTAECGDRSTERCRFRRSYRQSRYPETASDPSIPLLPRPTSENTAAAVPQPYPVVSIALDRIVNSDFNPRKSFSEESLQELADSIAQVGVLQPICVRPKDDMFEIVYGERRYWATVIGESDAYLGFRPRNERCGGRGCRHHGELAA